MPPSTVCYAVYSHFRCLSELRDQAGKSRTEKAGPQEHHGRARGCETDATIKLGVQEPMIDNFCNMHICTMFLGTSVGELLARCLVMRS